jgi:hypothetical protein
MLAVSLAFGNNASGTRDKRRLTRAALPRDRGFCGLLGDTRYILGMSILIF